MNANLISPTQGVFTGLTFGTGALKWLTVNSDAITPLVMLVTAAAAVIFGSLNWWTNNQRNKITKRNIIETLITDMEYDGREIYTAEDIKIMLRKQ